MQTSINVVICLEQGADLHTAWLMPLPLTVSCFSKIQIGFPFWYRLTWILPDKGPLNVCVLVKMIGVFAVRRCVLQVTQMQFNGQNVYDISTFTH